MKNKFKVGDKVRISINVDTNTFYYILHNEDYEVLETLIIKGVNHIKIKCRDDVKRTYASHFFELASSTQDEDKKETNESIVVLQECIDLQRKKSQDYQNPNSRVKQIDYYPNGLQSIMDIINTKYLRVISLMESEDEPNFEGIEDSLKDMINYASFGVSYTRGRIPGQETKDVQH